MRIPRIRLTYANVVSTLALFLALGGVSYAAVKLPANSVGEKQLKKNAVTGKKIKKNAITGDKIKAGTISSSDIKLSTLGKVPSATRADSSANTDHLQANAKRVNASATGISSQDAVRAQAAAVPLLDNGQVSLYGKCYVYGSTIYAETFGKTTADGALMWGGSYAWYGSGGYLNTSTPESQRYQSYASTGPDSVSYSGSYQYGTLFGADGNGINWQSNIFVKRGNVPTYGNGAYGAGDVCVFNVSGQRLTG